MLRVSFQNSGGELAAREVRSGAEALAAINEMLDGIDLHPGDKIVISGEEEEAE